MRRKYFKADLEADKSIPYTEIPLEEVPEAQANLVSSISDDGYNEERLGYDVRHFPVLDLDFPCELIPSSSPGKFHLYLNREVTWLHYSNILTALAVAGILEPGYVAASLARGMTLVRKPGVFKVVK